MEADATTWLATARALIIISAFVAFGWALLRMRQESAEQLERMLAEQQRSRADFQALNEKLSALTTLVASLPARTERPVEAPPPPAPRREVTPVRSYETARRLAKSGATVEEIVATCGVAGTEARLLRRLHGAGAAGRDSAA